MNSTPSGADAVSRRKCGFGIAAVALALAHLGWILAHFSPATMSPDANGYVVQARLLATEGTTSLIPGSPAQFIGTHWLETSDGAFRSRYSAGLPVLCALAWKWGGLRAALLVNPLLASGTVLLVFLLARRFADDGSALLAAAVLATNAMAQQHALDADAHTAAAFFLTAGLLAALRYADQPAPWRGFLAGLLLGIVPTIRYPEAVAGVAVGVWLLWRIRPFGRWWPAVAGAAVPIVALLAHNASAYGAFWRTGYALTGEQTGFGWSYFTAHALSYLQNLSGEGLGIFFAFGVAGLAGLIADRRQRADGLLLAGIAVPLVLLYMAYYFDGGNGSLRFLIPTFPLFAVAGAWLLTRIRLALGAAGWAVWITVAAVQLGVGGASAVQTATRLGRSLRSAVQLRALLEKKAPAGSVVVGDHQLDESLDATGQWRLVEENLVSGGRVGMRGGGPMARRRMAGRGGPGGMGGMGGPQAASAGRPSPQQANKNRAQHARYDNLPAAQRQARVWADIRTWAGGRPVFWLARSLDNLEDELPEGADYTSIGEVDAPSMGGGGPGAGPGGGRAGMLAGGPGRGGFLPGGDGPALEDGPGGPGMAIGGGRNGLAASGQKLRLVRIDFGKAK